MIETENNHDQPKHRLCSPVFILIICVVCLAATLLACFYYCEQSFSNKMTQLRLDEIEKNAIEIENALLKINDDNVFETEFEVPLFLISETSYELDLNRRGVSYYSLIPSRYTEYINGFNITLPKAIRDRASKLWSKYDSLFLQVLKLIEGKKLKK